MKKTKHGKGAACATLGARTCLWLALCAPVLPQIACAQSNGAAANGQIGHATQTWLELQRSNAQAAPALPMLGAEAGYAYRRYLKSFDTAIPATFGSSLDTGSSQGLTLNMQSGSGGSN